LEQPGDAVETPAPEPERAVDTAVLNTVLAVEASPEVLVKYTISTPPGTKVGRVESENRPSTKEELEDREAPLDPLIGKSIVSSLPLDSILPIAYQLIITYL
jgi:hypothetical protein